jgi:hypothetical protein
VGLITGVVNERDNVHGFDKDLDKTLELLLYTKENMSPEIRYYCLSLWWKKLNRTNDYELLSSIGFYWYEIWVRVLATSTSKDIYSILNQNLNQMDISLTWIPEKKELFHHIYKTYIKRGKVTRFTYLAKS